MGGQINAFYLLLSIFTFSKSFLSVSVSPGKWTPKCREARSIRNVSLGLITCFLTEVPTVQDPSWVLRSKLSTDSSYHCHQPVPIWQLSDSFLSGPLLSRLAVETQIQSPVTHNCITKPEVVQDSKLDHVKEDKRKTGHNQTLRVQGKGKWRKIGYKRDKHRTKCVGWW